MKWELVIRYSNFSVVSLDKGARNCINQIFECMKLVFVICFVAFINCLEIMAQENKIVPKNNLGDTSQASTEIPWLKNSLSSVNEEVLTRDTSKNEIYRFSWFRSFQWPIVIKLEKKNDAVIISWKKFGLATEPKKFKLLATGQKNIDKKSWQRFKDRFDRTDFWNMESEIKLPGSHFDGATWILEGKIVGRYHTVSRWSPNDSDYFYQTCDFLIRLTDLNISEAEKY